VTGPLCVSLRLFASGLALLGPAFPSMKNLQSIFEVSLDPEVLSSADVHNPLREFPMTSPTLVSAPTLTRLLWDHQSAAFHLSVSVRASDYLIAADGYPDGVID